MRLIALALVLLLAPPSYGERKRKPKPKPTPYPSFLSRVFAPQHTPKPKTIVKNIVVVKSPTPTPKPDCCRTVDSQWMAEYLELVAFWQYPIPEEKEIRYKDGNYIVPIVVFRHYQDMKEAIVRNP